MVVPFQEKVEVNKTYSNNLSDIISANEIPIDKKVKLYSQTKEKHKNSPISVKETPETDNITDNIKQEDNENKFVSNEETINSIIEKTVQEVLKKDKAKTKRITADKKISRELNSSSAKKGPAKGLRSKKQKINPFSKISQISGNSTLLDIGNTPKREQFMKKNSSLNWDAFSQSIDEDAETSLFEY